MNLYSDTQLHQDHCQWTEERALWRDEIRMWEQEVEELEAKLTRLQATLAHQKHELQVHAASIRIYAERDGRREQLLADYERNRNEERGMVLAQAHEGEIHQHQRQAMRHEEIKAHQRQLMTKLRALTTIADSLPPSLMPQRESR